MVRKNSDCSDSSNESSSNSKDSKDSCTITEKTDESTCSKIIFGKDGRNGKDGKDGKDGKNGKDGKDGMRGKRGKCGKNGLDGKDGKDGKNGIDGKDGKDGKDGIDGKDGKDGKDGIDGKDGKDGKDGTNGTNVFANYYGLQPLNTLPQVAPGLAVEFPTDGPNNGTEITRLTPSTFNITNPGNYLVIFNVTFVEPAELLVKLNNVELPQTLVARAVGETQLIGNYIINVTNPNTVLAICNPLNAPNPLTISPNTGNNDNNSLSSHLNIMKLI